MGTCISHLCCCSTPPSRQFATHTHRPLHPPTHPHPLCLFQISDRRQRGGGLTVAHLGGRVGAGRALVLLDVEGVLAATHAQCVRLVVTLSETLCTLGLSCAVAWMNRQSIGCEREWRIQKRDEKRFQKKFHKRCNHVTVISTWRVIKYTQRSEAMQSGHERR
jgi:hypothetical protein